jgi:CheY-like chemotaxis protein
MAILNVAVNARDAMRDGGSLTIAASDETVGHGHRSKLPRGSYIRLSVADTGVGMDEPTLKRAVEPFFSTKGVGRGTGLGLSMVHGLAAQLGGALTIQSKPGVGTNVELWLPIGREAAPESATAPEIGKPVAAGIALLVDDEELIRLSTADMLAELGYAVVEAGSAEEAVKLVDGGQQFDLLVTDHLMPGMSGTELARALRERRPGAPVLIISGYAELDGIAPDLPRLTKPFRRAELAASVSSLIAGAGSDGQRSTKRG